MNQHLKNIRYHLRQIYKDPTDPSNKVEAEYAWKYLNDFLNELETLYLDATDPAPIYEGEEFAARDEGRAEVANQLDQLLKGEISITPGEYVVHRDKIEDFKS